MISRVCKCLLILAVLLVLPLAASAQAPPNCQSLPTVWYFPDPVPFGFFLVGGGQGLFSAYIEAMLSTCTPVRPPCPKCLAAGRPISLSSGNTYIEETDIKIPGLGGGLSLSRTWNSLLFPESQLVPAGNGYVGYQVLQILPGIFGVGWRSTYEERLYLGADYYLTYLRSDGSNWAFGWDPSSSQFRVVAPANIAATLSGTTITFQNGEQRQFNSSTGSLTAIIDRNGNTTSISYDSSGRLSTVTDPAARHLTFTYSTTNPNLVASVASDVGISVSYTYNPYLTQVTEQDLSTLNFSFNPQNMISQVTDSQGKVIESHTYDSSGRGLTSSKANGVEAVTIVYP
jgi:YD repeat-containing protein